MDVSNKLRVAAIAATQLGLVASRQAREVGVTDDQLCWMARHGDLERRHAAVFRVTGAPWSWRQDVLAACLAVDGPVMASHRTAAQLWDLVERIDALEITVPRPCGPTPRGVVVHRLRDFRGQDARIRHGIPVTNPLRAIVDLGTVAPELVPHAIDVAMAKRLVTVSGLHRFLEEIACKGRAGVGVLRQVLDDRGVGKAESVAEGLFRRALRRRGVAIPVEQHEVWDRGVLVARIDFADPDLLLAWEVVGYEFHSSYEALQRDEARRKALQRLGWEVNGVYWAQLVKDPAGVARDVAHDRERRRAQLRILGG